MASPNRQSKPYTYRTEQEIGNNSYDEQYQLALRGTLGYRSDIDAFVPINVSPSGETLTAKGDYAVQVDPATSTTTYIGKATIGSSTSASVWQIKKIDTSSGVSITWASGNNGFTKAWTGRAGLSYS